MNNCISYWYPILQEVGVLQPKTVFTRMDWHLEWAAASDPDSYAIARDTMVLLTGLATEFMLGKVELPIFLRSGQTAARQFWRTTCLIEDLHQLLPHAMSIAECSQRATVRPLDTNVWALRELINTRPLTKCFQGMPIDREKRFFTDNGNIVYVLPRWSKRQIREGQPVNNEWEEKYDDFFRQDNDAWVSAPVKAAGDALGGRLAIDMLADRFGTWWLIDVQHAQGSDGYDQARY